MLAFIRHRSRTLHRDQRGLTTVEYTIVLCLIAALSVGAWGKFGKLIKKSLEDSKDDIADVIGS